MQAVTVRQLNLYVKSLLEGEKKLNDITVVGELSNFKNHYSSGHWYFTLKDSAAAIRGVMFRFNTARVKFTPCDGMQVLVRGRVSIYEKDGQYQFYAEEMLPAGEGDIALAFEQIKQKLADEGMFDAANKRPIAPFPKRIAVVTSDTGAAVQDILNILGRRYPLCEVMLCPVAVQGEAAVPDMLNALDRIYKLADVDTIIIGRGGGSAEDLWAFNSEELARKIYESPIPVISAVGHETDFTICDFVADLRAPTPSAAAELAVPDSAELLLGFKGISTRLINLVKHKYDVEQARFERLRASAFLRRPEMLTESSLQRLDRLSEKLHFSFKSKIDNITAEFSQTVALLDSLSPLKVLSRGFSVASKDGAVIKSVNELENGDNIDIRLSDGSASCIVEGINNAKN